MPIPKRCTCKPLADEWCDFCDLQLSREQDEIEAMRDAEDDDLIDAYDAGEINQFGQQIKWRDQ